MDERRLKTIVNWMVVAFFCSCVGFILLVVSGITGMIAVWIGSAIVIAVMFVMLFALSRYDKAISTRMKSMLCEECRGIYKKYEDGVL